MKKNLAKDQFIVKRLVYDNASLIEEKETKLDIYESGLKQILYYVSKVDLLNLKLKLVLYEYKFN